MIDHLDITVDGLDCTGCVSDLETILLDKDGILSVVVAYSEDRISIEYDAELMSGERIIEIVRKMGLTPRKPR